MRLNLSIVLCSPSLCDKKNEHLALEECHSAHGPKLTSFLLLLLLLLLLSQTSGHRNKPSLATIEASLKGACVA